jgi:peptidoglycan/xylan/chitin deacetylase (PgdA/CDA1 family)
MLAADLKYLRKHYKVISYDELCRRRGLSGEGTSERGSTPAVIVTFDDGYRECFTQARPLLLKYEIPAVFFITTDFVDNKTMFYRNKVSLCIDQLKRCTDTEISSLCDSVRRSLDARLPDEAALVKWLKSLSALDEPTIDRVCELLNVDWRGYLAEHQPYMTADQIRQLALDGFTIGAHGCNHVRLSELNCEPTESTHPAPIPAPRIPHPASPVPTVQSEIVDSCRSIAALAPAGSIPFAFPFSGDGISRNRLGVLRACQHEIGIIFDRRGFRPDEDFVVHRIIADRPAADGHSNLDELLREAYQREARLKLRKRIGSARDAAWPDAEKTSRVVGLYRNQAE